MDTQRPCPCAPSTQFFSPSICPAAQGLAIDAGLVPVVGHLGLESAAKTWRSHRVSSSEAPEGPWFRLPRVPFLSRASQSWRECVRSHSELPRASCEATLQHTPRMSRQKRFNDEPPHCWVMAAASAGGHSCPPRKCSEAILKGW